MIAAASFCSQINLTRATISFSCLNCPAETPSILVLRQHVSKWLSSVDTYPCFPFHLTCQFSKVCLLRHSYDKEISQNGLYPRHCFLLHQSKRAGALRAERYGCATTSNSEKYRSRASAELTFSVCAKNKFNDFLNLEEYSREVGRASSDFEVRILF